MGLSTMVVVFIESERSWVMSCCCFLPTSRTYDMFASTVKVEVSVVLTSKASDQQWIYQSDMSCVPSTYGQSRRRQTLLE